MLKGFIVFLMLAVVVSLFSGLFFLLFCLLFPQWPPQTVAGDIQPFEVAEAAPSRR